METPGSHAAHTGGAHGAGEEHSHHSIGYYVGITIALGIVTIVETGPLFGWFHVPALALIILSVLKFAAVVAFFMHLWDDAPIFTKLFAAPLAGASLMVIVLIALHHTWVSPGPGADFNGDGKITVSRNEHVAPLPIAERYADTYNGECNAWLRSHISNRWYCSSPPYDPKRLKLHIYGAPKEDTGPTVDLVAMGEAERKDWLMKHGEEKYKVACAACHQATGQGVPGAFPGLVGAVTFYGDAVRQSRIIVHGLAGQIEVNGVSYNGVMPAQHKDFNGSLSTIDVAAVATYVRNSWGNNDGIVMPADVEAAIKAGKLDPAKEPTP